jgi:hypothetical protein
LLLLLLLFLLYSSVSAPDPSWIVLIAFFFLSFLPSFHASSPLLGEIKYASDLASPPGTLYAALVLSNVASGTIGSISATAALAAPGVSNFFSAADLTVAQNTWGPTIPDEQLMASSTVRAPHPTLCSWSLFRLSIIHTRNSLFAAPFLCFALVASLIPHRR